MTNNNQGFIGAVIALIALCGLLVVGFLYWQNRNTTNQSVTSSSVTPTPVQPVDIGTLKLPSNLDQWKEAQLTDGGHLIYKLPPNWVENNDNMERDLGIHPEGGDRRGIDVGVLIPGLSRGYYDVSSVDDLIDKYYSDNDRYHLLQHEVANLPNSDHKVHIMTVQPYRTETEQSPREKSDLFTRVLIPGIPTSVGGSCHTNGILAFLSITTENATEDLYAELLKQIASTVEVGTCPSK
jgi:hypothetical protein